MSTELVRDILIKAAEDVQSGMWCTTQWFAGCELTGWLSNSEGYEAYAQRLTTDQMQKAGRCAEGSIMLATRLLGGSGEDYAAAVAAVENRLGESRRLYLFNDIDLPEDDPFVAGQQLAELFRGAAEDLL